MIIFVLCCQTTVSYYIILPIINIVSNREEVATKTEIKKGATVKEFETDEHCWISEVANDAGDELISIARARVKPGITTQWHLLEGVDERYIIIAGKGRVDLDDLKPADVSGGDVVRIPADTPQRITNTGDTDLIFYCVCSPPFQVDCYKATE